MNAHIIKHAFVTAALMVAFAVVCTLLLSTTYFGTRVPIAESEAEARMQLFRQILPEQLHDNDLLQDTVKIAAGGALKNHEETLAYRARLNGQPAAVILETVAPDGYSGDITLLLAIRADGELAGVRVLAHKETPGLGDYIDIAHSDWIKKNFDDQSLSKTPEDQWKVKKDGGRFDSMAGATITPRAVVKAVQGALKYFADRRDELFTAQAAQEPLL